MNKTKKILDLHPTLSSFEKEVKEGLLQKNKKIPPKFFYDEIGSQLFERATKEPEYYLTRTEKELLKKISHEIANIVGKGVVIIEPGCGSCQKIKLLLGDLQPNCYVPIDISREFLIDSVANLQKEYPELNIFAICADYVQPLKMPDEIPKNRLAFFPGSTIGNFEPEEAQKFLKNISSIVDYLLIGVDLEKDKNVLEDAYNDKNLICANFNMNLLDRINKELKGNFDTTKFCHYAYYNKQNNRIEMHLKSLSKQKVKIGQHEFVFEKGETIHTENSYKYTIESFQNLAKTSHFYPIKAWTDPNTFFSLHLFKIY